MPVKYFIILIILPLLNLNGEGQNLFPNPGFEDVSVIKKGEKYYYQYAQWPRLLPVGEWGNVLGLPKFSIYQSRDTFNGKYDNNWNPHTGDSYFIHTFAHTPNLNFAELIQPLIKDSLYHFEIFQKVFVNRLIDSVFIKGQLGVWFTNTDFRDPGNLELLKNGKIKYKPQIWIKQILPNAYPDYPGGDHSTIDSHNNYHPYKQTFTPDQNYKYAILGNHQPFMEYGVEMFTERKSISYRLDDIYISLQPKNSTLEEKETAIAIERTHRIFFESNASNPSHGEIEKLNQFLSSFTKHIKSIELHGHTDCIGSESSNLELSQQRALVIAAYLKQKGVPDNVITIQSFGKSKAELNSDSEEIKAKNRKVEMIVNYLN